MLWDHPVVFVIVFLYNVLLQFGDFCFIVLLLFRKSLPFFVLLIKSGDIRRFVVMLNFVNSWNKQHCDMWPVASRDHMTHFLCHIAVTTCWQVSNHDRDGHESSLEFQCFEIAVLCMNYELCRCKHVCGLKWTWKTTWLSISIKGYVQNGYRCETVCCHNSQLATANWQTR